MLGAVCAGLAATAGCGAIGGDDESARDAAAAGEHFDGGRAIVADAIEQFDAQVGTFEDVVSPDGVEFEPMRLESSVERARERVEKAGYLGSPAQGSRAEAIGGVTDWLAVGVELVVKYARADEMVSIAASRWLESEYEAASAQFKRTQGQLDVAMNRVEGLQSGVGDLDWDTLDGVPGIAREECQSIVTKAREDIVHLDKSMENGERRGEGLNAAMEGIAAWTAGRTETAGRQFQAAGAAFDDAELAVEDVPPRWADHFEALQCSTKRSSEAATLLLRAFAAHRRGEKDRAQRLFERGRATLHHAEEC